MAPTVPFKGQKYEELRKQHGPDNLFEDPEFPANDKSLFYKRSSPGNIEWKRPGVSVIQNSLLMISHSSIRDPHLGI